MCALSQGIVRRREVSRHPLVPLQVLKEYAAFADAQLGRWQARAA